MKKLYTLALALVTITASAQFEINFDDMTTGDVSSQSPHIVMWPAAGVTDAQVTGEYYYSADYSMLLRENDGSNVDDILINLGNKNAGVWSVEFMVFVPFSKTGFWNFQENESATPNQWNGQFFVGATETGGPDGSGGTSGMITSDQVLESVAYPQGEWFKAVHVIDFNEGTINVEINGEMLMVDHPYSTIIEGALVPAEQLGSINFYSIDANNEMYIDDFKLIEGNALSTDTFDAVNFNVYPNPVKDRLNIQSQNVVDQVAIYNVLGKLVYQGLPNIVSPSVDMSNFNSGVYFVEVTIGNASKTVKVIK